MDRKNFLSSFIIGGFLSSAKLKFSDEGDNPKPIVIPPYLKAGDIVGITCPAGDIPLKEIQSSMMEIQSWGLKIRIGDTVGKKDFILGGTDAERLRDFQQMLDDPSVKAILCARGGYGSVRIIDQLDFSGFAKHPKWIIGFSDITVIHAHIHRNYNIASIHSKMCNSFPEDPAKAEKSQIDSIYSIRQCLTGEKTVYTFPPDLQNRTGTAEGQLIGGNLKTLETLSGTKSDISTADKIFFVEDTGEYLYGIDRMFWNLKRTGKLSRLKALIIGGFNVKPDDPGEEFGKTLYDIVWEKVKSYAYPVCFGFPVGHQKENYALKCGLTHRLTVDQQEIVLKEI